MTDDQVADLLVSYTDGRSVKELAETFSVHRTTVMDHLERSGIPRRACVRQFTDENVTEAAEHYAEGESLATVAARFAVSPRTVAREFKKAGIETRARRGYERASR